MLVEEVLETEEIIEEEEMPSFNHSYICWQISQQLSENKEIAPLPELTLDIDKGITPDICVYPLEQVKPDFFQDFPRYSQMPILAIEVISASQNIQDLLDKAKMLTSQGVRTVWVIEPYTRSVFVIDKNNRRIIHNDLVESEGIKVDFRQIFGTN